MKAGMLKNDFLDWSESQTLSDDFFEVVKRHAVLRRGDILVASTGVGSLGKADLFDSDRRAVADAHVSIVRLRKGETTPNLVVHLMRHRFVQWQIDQGLTGATNQVEIHPGQIENLRLPVIEPEKCKRLTADIDKIEKALRSERARLKPFAELINEILCREFGYPLREYRERTRKKQYFRSLSAVATGFLLRDSAKFHHPHFEVTQRFFAEIRNERVKGFLAIPIRLGATAAKGDFVEEGGAFYVHPGATKKERVIALEDCHRITSEFCEKKRRRFSLQPGDVVLNRSGEGTIGKSGFFDSSGEDVIFADFTMRIRFHPRRMCARFGWYYFCSVIFQSQIEHEKRGMGNMTNIFSSQVERVLVPVCTLTRQQALAEKIDPELAKLERAHAAIESKRAEITKLVDAAIRTS